MQLCIIRFCQLKERSLKLRSAILTNNTKTPLYFKMLTAEPFSIVQLDSDTHRPTAQLTSTDITSLRPRENAVVCMQLKIMQKYVYDKVRSASQTMFNIIMQCYKFHMEENR